MRAVNLIPVEERRGGAGAPGRSGSGVYVLLGVLGALLAIPVAAALQILVKDWWHFRHHPESSSGADHTQPVSRADWSRPAPADAPAAAAVGEPSAAPRPMPGPPGGVEGAASGEKR